MRIHHNTIGLAILCRSRVFLKDMMDWIKAANLVRIVFRKPDEALMINGHIPGTGTGGWHSPLLKRMLSRIKHTERIVHRHWKPEVSLAHCAKCQEKRLCKLTGQLVIGYPV